MKRSFFICLLHLCSFFAFANVQPLPCIPALRQSAIPVNYSSTKKDVVLYIPSSCSGMVNDAVAGEGVMAVVVLGQIQHGQLLVKIKVDYKGTALTTVEGINYQVSGSMAAFETASIGPEPVDVFIKGSIKLEENNKASQLFVSDVGYITIYPDGSVGNHILDSGNNPAYSQPKVFCGEGRK